MKSYEEMRKFRKKVSFGMKILKSKILKRYVPFQMQISLTNQCNLKCSYCYALYPDRPHSDAETNKIFSLIDEMADAGTRRINLVGGEPLLRKDIGAIIRHIKSRNMDCALTTNGYLVPRKISELLPLDLICLSIDGDREATDQNRAKGCYDKVREAMEVLKQNKVPFQVSAVLTSKSIHSFKHLLDLGKAEGFSVGFTTLIEQTVDGVKLAPPGLPSDQEYKEILTKILQWKREGYPVLFSEKVIKYAKNWNLPYARDKIMNEAPNFKHIKCNAGKYFGIVDVNGDVYPCPATVDVMKVENAFDSGFSKAFAAINHHSCKTCHIPCQNEFSRMYDLDPGVLKNISANYKSAT